MDSTECDTCWYYDYDEEYDEYYCMMDLDEDEVWSRVEAFCTACDVGAVTVCDRRE